MKQKNGCNSVQQRNGVPNATVWLGTSLIDSVLRAQRTPVFIQGFLPHGNQDRRFYSFEVFLLCLEQNFATLNGSLPDGSRHHRRGIDGTKWICFHLPMTKDLPAFLI
jgi:hypothetical protein